jgi:SWI/SNF-related matrix-associated actin-dependent regulator 1 of chromatin subfamily A
MASDDIARDPLPEPGSEASTAAEGEGDARSASDATILLTRRLRVAETTVEALETALARKEQLLGEAAERERALRAALEAARLEPGAFPGPSGSGPSASGSAGADASAETEHAKAADAWRERALAAESARETAAHAAERLGDENAALRAILERARDAETAGTRDDDDDDDERRKRKKETTLGLELRAAVAEGAAASSRARAEEAESALGAWQAHARELTSRLERWERRRAAGDDACLKNEESCKEEDEASANSALAATVASLAERVEETERLLAASLPVNRSEREGRESVHDDPRDRPKLIGAIDRDETEEAAKEAVTPETRRARAEAAAAQLERSRVALRRNERGGAIETDGGGGFLVGAAADAASSALAKALWNARRVAETAEQRGASGAAALERARVLERAAAAKLARVEVGVTGT